MRELTFSSFLVNDGNRRAHELCLAISRGEPIAPLPLVLVGERGSGKSHLLHAVAQRLRASVGHAAIVMLSPHSNPGEIDRIVADPKPIDMARFAVLLVDDFHALPIDPEKTARLIRIFEENDHPVILSSEVHPDRLTKLSPALLRTIRSGQIVFIDGSEAKTTLDVIETRIREEQREAIDRLERRIREMESAGPDALAQDARRRAKAAEQTERDLAEARAEIEHLRGEVALLSVSSREAIFLRKKLDEIERERVAAATRPAAETNEESIELKRKLDEARFDAQKAREEARGMLERAQHLLEALHKSREDYETARRERDRHREELLKFQGLPAPIAGGDTDPVQPATGAGEVLAASGPDLEALREEIHRLQESLVRARAERDNSKSHLAHIRDDLDTALADLERARAESLAESEAFRTRIRELEEALVARQTEIDRLRAAQDAFTEEVRMLQSQVTEGADVLSRLMQLFGTDRANETEPDDPEEHTPENTGDSAPPRADFGEGIRLVPRRGPSLHHIEEIRGHNAVVFPGGLPPLDDDTGDIEPGPRSARSA